MTRVVVLLIGLAMFAVLAGLLWYVANRFERAGEEALASIWRPGEVAADDGLHVVIERVTTAGTPEVLESRELGVVPATDPERAARLEDLRTLARDRARLLNDQARQA